MNYNTTYGNSLPYQNTIPLPMLQPNMNNYQSQMNYYQTPMNIYQQQVSYPDNYQQNMNYYENYNEDRDTQEPYNDVVKPPIFTNKYFLSDTPNIVGGNDIKKDSSVPDFSIDNLRQQIASNPTGILNYIKNSLPNQATDSKYIKYVVTTILDVLNDDFGRDIVEALSKYTPKDTNLISTKEYLLNKLTSKGFSKFNLKDLLDLDNILSSDPKFSSLIKSALNLSVIALKNMKENSPDVYNSLLFNNFNGAVINSFNFLKNFADTNKIIAEFKIKQYNQGDVNLLLQEKLVLAPPTPEPVPVPAPVPTPAPAPTTAPTTAPVKPETTTLTKATATAPVKPETTVPAKATVTAPVKTGTTAPALSPTKKSSPTSKQKGGSTSKYFNKYLHYKALYLELKNIN